MNESRLVYQIMQELGKHGAVFRTNAGHYFTKSGHRVSGLPKGFSDLLFIGPGGNVCFIECKIQGNKASPEQTQFIERMKTLGARAGIAHTVAEAAQICELEDKND